MCLCRALDPKLVLILSKLPAPETNALQFWLKAVKALETWPAKTDSKKASALMQQFRCEKCMMALQELTVQPPSFWRAYTSMNVSGTSWPYT
jgi:hypothetical protein